MTQFVKHCFLGYEYLDYRTEGKSRFVARFSYPSMRRDKGSFIRFLIKNFTVEEYFNRLDAGESPLKILESKGYIMPHVKKLLKAAGYPVTPRGYKQMVEDQAAEGNVKVTVSDWPRLPKSLISLEL